MARKDTRYKGKKWYRFFGIETIRGSKQTPNVPSALFSIEGGGVIAIPMKEIKKIMKEMR